MLYRCSAVAAAIFGCVGESLCRRLAGPGTSRSRQDVLHRWTAWLARQLALEIVVEGAPPAQGLIVANHLSYLDILVFCSIAPCAFVSKREVKGWPGFGWAASLTGTVYIDRTRRSATRSVQPHIEAALAGGGRLVLFPEATSTDGSSLLPFHSSLLQPVIAAGAPITAAHLSYELEEGDPRWDVCYWGDMTLVPHALKLFRKSGVRAKVRFGEQAQTFHDRKQAAHELWKEVNALAHPVETEALAKEIGN